MVADTGEDGSEVPDNSPTQVLDELKPFLFTYIVLGPLLSALFAEQIDNWLVCCALFVALVGLSFAWVRKRLVVLEEAIREQESRLVELTARMDGES